MNKTIEEKDFEEIRKVVESIGMIREREWEDNEDSDFETVLDKARNERETKEKMEEYLASLKITPFKDKIYDIKSFCDDMEMMITDEAHDVILDEHPVFGFGFRVNNYVKWLDFINYDGIFSPLYTNLYLMDDYNDWMASPEVERILKKHLPLMNVNVKVVPRDFESGESGHVGITLTLKDDKLLPYIERREEELYQGKDTMGIDNTKSHQMDMMWKDYKEQKELAEKYRKDSDWNKVDGKGMDEMVTEADEEDATEDTTAEDNADTQDGDAESGTDTGTEDASNGDDSTENTENGEDGGEENKDDGENKDGDKKEDEPKDDKEKEEKEKGPLKPGETTHLESFEELFNENSVKIKVQKQGLGPEPSPMFGQSSAKHNKYKVSLTNDKGGDVSWIFWDSEKNTEDNTVPDTEVIMKEFGLRLEAAVVGTSFENFKEQFGYDNVDNTLAQKQYNGLRKMKDDIKKIFPDQHNVYQLIQIAKKS